MQGTLPDKKTFALELLRVATEYIGVNRQDNRDQITKFLNIFGLGFADENGTPYAFCDAGVGYSAAKALCNLTKTPYTPQNSVQVFKSVLDTIASHYFKPSASCRITQADAIHWGKWIEVDDRHGVPILPGFLVLYSWDGGAEADHIEIIESANADTMTTIAFNTSSDNFRNGGAVARKVRPYAHVLGFVRMY